MPALEHVNEKKKTSIFFSFSLDCFLLSYTALSIPTLLLPFQYTDSKKVLSLVFVVLTQHQAAHRVSYLLE